MRFEEGAQTFDLSTIANTGVPVFGRKSQMQQALMPATMAVSQDEADRIDDELMDLVHDGLGDLKQQAFAMGSELDRQQIKVCMRLLFIDVIILSYDCQLEQLEVGVDLANDRIRRANRDIRELM